jgi:hypothetical protein
MYWQLKGKNWDLDLAVLFSHILHRLENKAGCNIKTSKGNKFAKFIGLHITHMSSGIVDQ